MLMLRRCGTQEWRHRGFIVGRRVHEISAVSCWACFRAGVCVDFSGRVGRPESDCDNCFGSSTCEIFQIISLCIC